jgi:cytochrome c peroxidase
VEARLAAIPEYRARFAQVFKENRPSVRNVWQAIAMFERTITQTDTPYDRYLRGNVVALSDQEKSGFELFRGKAKCIACHNGALLTDEQFYNTGVPMNPRLNRDVLAKISFDFMQGINQAPVNELPDDGGLYYLTKNAEDKGKFRTAPLRYIKYTAPYMHNGAFGTLREVVEFYNAGGGINAFSETKTEKITPLYLSPKDIDDLCTFLEALGGSEVRVDRPALPSYPAQLTGQ